MKPSTLLALGLVATTPLTASAEAGSSHGTAQVLEQGEWEVGVFAPLRRGLSQGLEVSIHPLTALVSPNIALKKQWTDGGTWTLASRHSLHFPARLLRALATEGTGGVLPADATIPTIAASDNRLLASTELRESTTLTASLRAVLGAQMGEGAWPSLDMPIAYPRTAAYQDGASFALGGQVDGDLWKSWDYRVSTTFWALPWSDGKWAAESKLNLSWRPSKRFASQVTLTGAVGDYPYGTAWHALPGFDFIWRW